MLSSKYLPVRTFQDGFACGTSQQDQWRREMTSTLRQTNEAASHVSNLTERLEEFPPGKAKERTLLYINIALEVGVTFGSRCRAFRFLPGICTLLVGGMRFQKSRGASQAIEALVDPEKQTKKEDELVDAVHAFVSLFDSGLMRQPQEIWDRSPDYLPYWIGDIETFDAGKKGRGVRATADLAKGQVVLIERPIAFSEFGGNEATKSTLVTSIGEMKVSDSTQCWVKQTIVGRSHREGLLSSICNHLYDGSSSRPLVPFKSLIPNISSTRVLLPSHHEFMPGDSVRLTAQQVEGIVSTNSHGSGSYSDPEETSEKCTQLYPGMSMFNHSSNPTCIHLPTEGTSIAALSVAWPVKAGGELTVCYHPDEEKAKRAWGLE